MNRKALENVLLFAYEGMREKWGEYPDFIARNKISPYPQGLLARIRIRVNAAEEDPDKELSVAAKEWCEIYREWLCAL